MRHSIALTLVLSCVLSAPSFGQQSDAQKLEELRKRAAQADKKKAEPKKPLKPRADGLIPMNAQQTVLVDRKKKRVYLKTTLCNRDAMLEMFLCLKERKEHESILSLDGDAIHVHTALLMVGAEAGAPAEFRPKYIPSHGQEIDVFVNWKDKDGKAQRCRAQEWIQHSVNRYHVEKLETLPPGVKVPFDELRYDTRRKELLWFGPMSEKQHKNLYDLSEDKTFRTAIDKFKEAGRIRKMEAKFIFAGSFFFENKDFPRFYTAEGGMVICVANMPEALLDINITSSGSDASRSFETRTDRLPPVGTEVEIELIPIGPKPSTLKKPHSAAKTKSPQDGKDTTTPGTTEPATKNGGE